MSVESQIQDAVITNNVRQSVSATSVPAHVHNGLDAPLVTIPSTLSNKRIIPRVFTTVTNSSLAIDTDHYDCVAITALASDIAFSATGTPTNFQSLIIRIKDNDSSHNLTWSGSFASRGAVLPTATVVSNTMTLGFKWNTALNTWDLLAYVYG